MRASAYRSPCRFGPRAWRSPLGSAAVGL